MGNVLVVVETQDGQLRTASLPAVTFGKQMAEKAGGKLSLLVVGAGVDGAAAEAAKYGAAEVLVADASGLEHYLAETYAPIVAKAAKDKGATVVAATSTVDRQGSVAARRGAARRGPGRPTSSPSSAPTQFKRPMMAGNVIATVEVDDADRGRHRAPDRVQAGRSRRARRRRSPSSTRPAAVDTRAEFVGVARSPRASARS